MRKKLKFLRRDIFIQKALLRLVIVSMILPYLLAITLPILGIWQLYSGWHLAKQLEDANRRTYLFLSASWFFVMIAVFIIDFNWTVSESEFWISLIYVIVPLLMAGGYYKYSKETLSDLEEYAICQF